MLLLFGMAWERYRVRRFILMTGILWHFLPPSETTYDKRGNGNGLQDENFHELHRWKPPVRLIPFDPSRIARIPMKKVDASSESNAGSGSNPQFICDDEDGDCGDTDGKDGFSSGNGIEVETVTSLPKNENKAMISSTTVSLVSRPKYFLTSTIAERKKESTVPSTGAPSRTKVLRLGTKSTSESIRNKKTTGHSRNETFTSARTNNVGYEHENTTVVPTTSPTARKYRVVSISKNLTRTTPRTKSLLHLNETSTATTKLMPPSLAKKRVKTTVTTRERTRSTGKVVTSSINPLVSTIVPTIARGVGSEKRGESNRSLENGQGNTSNPLVTYASTYLNETALKNNAEQINNVSLRLLNSSLIRKPSTSKLEIEVRLKGSTQNQNDTKDLTTAESRLLLNSTKAPKVVEELQLVLEANTSKPFKNVGVFSNRSGIQREINRTTTDLQMKRQLYKGFVLTRTTPVTELNRSAEIVSKVTLDKVLLSQSTSLQSSRTDLYENRVEKVAGNICQGVICRAGGVCREHGRNRGRCLCPIGTGGENCEKENQFMHPRFHGSSYLFFNNSKNVGKNFRVSIEFKADAMDGIIFFGGDPQNTTANFFTIILIDGYTQLRTNCGSGFIALTSTKKITASTWSRVTARKFKGRIYLQVNDELLVSGGNNCLKEDLSFSRVYLGGLQSNMLQVRNIGLVPGFTGCVKKFTIDERDLVLGSKDNRDINGIDIDDCTDGSCDATKCMNRGECIPLTNSSSRCSCRLGFTNADCSKGFNTSVLQFNGTGFIQFEGLGSSAWSKIEVEIIIKPQSQNGLLFYNGDRNDGHGDFILVSLKNGFVEFRFDCGTGEAIIRSRRKIALGKWHHIIVNRKGNIGYLSLDDDGPLVGKSKGVFQMLKLRQPLFIGGINSFSNIPISADSHTSFKGCIEKVIINKRKLQWANAVDGKDIYSCDSHDCVKGTCSKNGVCESHKGETWCHCYLGYNGKTCENETKISVPRFNGHSFLKFKDRELFRHLTLPTSVFSLEFKTSHPNGLILWNGQKHTHLRWKGDFLSLALYNGYMICRYNLGSGDVVLNSTRKLNDNKWHHIWLYRNKGQGRMQVDRKEIGDSNSRSNYTMLNTDGELFLGGAENIVSTTGSRHLHGLNGCIKNFKLGNRNINLIDNASGGHHVEQCF